MKKRVIWAALLLFCVFLAACGAKEGAAEAENTGNPGNAWQGIAPGMEDLNAITDRTEYYDIRVEQEDIDFGLWEKNPQDQQYELAVLRGGTVYLLIGTQFFRGEPVQLWVEASKEEKKLYLYRKDGEPELLLQDVPFQYVGYSSGYKWYLDRDGDFYCYNTTYPVVNGEAKIETILVKISSSGEVLYESVLDLGFTIDDICQLDDGRIYLLLKESARGARLLAEVDPATGNLVQESRKEITLEYAVYLGDAGDTLAVTGYAPDTPGHKISKYNAADGSLSPILYFTGTSYGWPSGMTLQDFRVLGDGSVEFFWTDLDGAGCLLERLRMEKVEKIPIVVRGVFYYDTWLAERAAVFNKQNSTYHVIIEDCGPGNDMEDFARLTSIQIGAGKGPDIVGGWHFLDDYIDGMLEKGALEELNPYMEASGIREEDYYPAAFATWRQGEKIYGVQYWMSVSDKEISEEVLGSRETPDIETLVDALLAWEGDGVYCPGCDAGWVLNSFLEASDSLWGMVDWESGSCDFDTPLFRKLLEAAMRYGDDGRNNVESGIATSRLYSNVARFEGRAEQEAAGWVTFGYLFDDGVHAVSAPYFTMGINANSTHKEGAWEFISFMIGEESQSEQEWLDVPVHRGVFETWMQEEIINKRVKEQPYKGGVYYPTHYGADVSEEKQEEYRKKLEDARPLPTRTVPILNIILEETGGYFAGSKSAETVIGIITNRVQVYLNERH